MGPVNGRNADPSVVAAKMARIREPHVAPLNDLAYHSFAGELWAEALAYARAAAEQFAKDSGADVGGIKSATQGYFSIDARDGEGGGEAGPEDRRGGQPAMSVYLHSSGQDASAAIHWYANELVDALLEVDPAGKVTYRATDPSADQITTALRDAGAA